MTYNSKDEALTVYLATEQILDYAPLMNDHEISNLKASLDEIRSRYITQYGNSFLKDYNTFYWECNASC